MSSGDASHRRQPDAEVDRDEPPLVASLLMDGSARLGCTARGVMRSLGRRTLLMVWAFGALATFLAILLLSVAQEPTLLGLLRGVGGGLVMALVFAAAMGWLLLWGLRDAHRDDAAEQATVSELEEALGPVLRELNAVRRDVAAQVKARSLLRVPLATLAAFGAWILGERSDDPPGLLVLPVFLIFGALAGEVWAAHKLDREYRRLYKGRVLPQIAARFGSLTYQHASHQEVASLMAHGIFQEAERFVAEDQIVGTYRNLPLSVVEARLTRRNGDNDVTVFDGLLVELTLPRALAGTTAVVTDRGVIGNWKAQWRSSGELQPVRLEDRTFEQRYEVYSSDQIEARALLTPAFMERFVALASGTGFSLPGALARGNRLLVAMPTIAGRDLFEPPTYWQRSGGRILAELNRDIEAVLRVADVVIDLDFWARGHSSSTHSGQTR